jgi:hypothetical protein
MHPFPNEFVESHPVASVRNHKRSARIHEPNLANRRIGVVSILDQFDKRYFRTRN